MQSIESSKNSLNPSVFRSDLVAQGSAAEQDARLGSFGAAADSHGLVSKTQENQSSLQEYLSNRVSQPAKKQSNPPSAPFPTVAQSDYIQNGLILPRDPKNLELILRDVDTKGYLDIELLYRLRQQESLGSVKQKIVRKIQQKESAFCFEDLVTELLRD